MKELLFLCHRIPYPPNKGDKIRAYHWLQALSTRYRVHLGTFIDDRADAIHRDALAALVDQACYRPLAPLKAKVRSLPGLVRRRSLSMGYYHDHALSRWVKQLLAARPIAAVVVFSSTMAPYVENHHGCPRVLDFVDVDSDKWRQYAARRRGVPRWVYAREARRLFAEERRLAADFDASVFVSEHEAAFFRHAAPESGQRVFAIGNGVDSGFFDPSLAHPDPHAGPARARVVFTGAMDYGANVDAVVWFVENVWPRIRQSRGDVEFVIVGARPEPAVKRLAEQPGVQVTGTVADVRPYLAHADVAVAPMRIARGIQNKVLEALAMGRPVVMSPQAAAGLDPVAESVAQVSDEPGAFADAVLRFTAREPARVPLAAARDYVRQHYGWARQFERLDALIDNACAVADADSPVAGADAHRQSA